MAASVFFVRKILFAAAIILAQGSAAANVDEAKDCPVVIQCKSDGCLPVENCNVFNANEVLKVASGVPVPSLSRREQQAKLDGAAFKATLDLRRAWLEAGLSIPENNILFGTQKPDASRSTSVSVSNSPNDVWGIPVYRSDECIGAVVAGVCHGSILPRTAVPRRCYGAMLNGKCTGPEF